MLWILRNGKRLRSSKIYHLNKKTCRDTILDMLHYCHERVLRWVEMELLNPSTPNVLYRGHLCNKRTKEWIK